MQLQAPHGRVLVAVDLESKNSHRFADGHTIRLERDYNNLNKRETQPVNATCLAAENIPAGAEVLIHHNSCHDVNRVFNLRTLGGDDTGTSVKTYSLSEGECFLWRAPDSEDWHPCAGFATGLRVFEPYGGVIQGIPPKLLKNTLYVTSGELKGQVVRTLMACDYEIVFQDRNGQEGRVIRFRHYEGEMHEREEVVALLPVLGEKVKKGDLYVGLSAQDARPLNP